MTCLDLARAARGVEGQRIGVDPYFAQSERAVHSW